MEIVNSYYFDMLKNMAKRCPIFPRHIISYHHKTIIILKNVDHEIKKMHTFSPLVPVRPYREEKSLHYNTQSSLSTTCYSYTKSTLYQEIFLELAPFCSENGLQRHTIYIYRTAWNPGQTKLWEIFNDYLKAFHSWTSINSRFPLEWPSPDKRNITSWILSVTTTGLCRQ